MKLANNHFKIDIVNALSNKALTEEFYLNHLKILKEKEVLGISSSDKEWTENPNVYLVSCSHNNKLIGGVRIHLNHADFVLPFEKVLSKQNPQYLSIVDRYDLVKYGESCGLWVQNGYRKIGIKQMLMRYSMVCAKHLELDHVFGICPKHTLDHFRTIGFIYCAYKNDVLEFPYPNDNYITLAIKCNVQEFKYAFRYEQKAMWSLYENPFQSMPCSGIKGSSEFLINSSIKKKSHDLIKKHREKRKNGENKRADNIPL